MTEQLPPAPPPDEAIKRILVRRVDECGLSPGMVAGIVDGGAARLVAHGRADAPGRPVGADTVFEVGSVTKLFTALLLADMAHRGEASLDEPVAALLPPGSRVPGRGGQAITLAQLAAHTSGLPRLPDDIVPGDPDPYGRYTADRLLAFLARHQLRRTPGEAYEYSNLGAGLLGHSLGVRLGQPYEDAVHDRILGPFGMSSTVFRRHPRIEDRTATGHDDSGDGVPAWTFDALAGAGGMLSTAADLLLFLGGVMDGAGPLAPAVATLLAAREAGGLGFGQAQAEGHVLLQHEGGTGGFRSHVACVPAWRRGAAVLANASTGAVEDLGIHCCDPRWGLQWFREVRAVDPAGFDRVTGTYRMRPGLLFEVTRDRDRLMVQLTGQPAFRVFPSSEWEVFYKVVGAQITFVPGPDGRAARLILHQNSRDQIAERVR